MPRVINFEGTKHSFPDDVTDDEISSALDQMHPAAKDPTKGLSGPASVDPKKIIQPVSRNPLEPPIVQQQINAGKQLPIGSTPDEVRSMAENALPLVGGALGGIPGAAAGSALKVAVGKKDPTINSAVTDIGIDTVGQGVGPAIIKAANKTGIANLLGSKTISNNSPSIQRVIKGDAATKATEAVEPLIHQETDTLKSIAKDAKESLLTNPSKMPSGSIGHDLYKAANGDIPLSKVSDRAFSNIDDLRQLKTLDPAGTEKLGLARVFKKTFDGPRVNPGKVLEELNGANSELYKEAVNPETHSNIVKLMTEAKSIADKPKSVIERSLSYGSGRFLLPIAASQLPLYGHEIAGASAALMGGIALGEATISKLMQNPETAKLVLQAIKTPLASPESGFIQKALIHSMRGGTVFISDANGKDRKVKVGPSGELQELK